jgi:hypothetical protein
MIIYNNIQSTGYILKMFGRIIDIPSLQWLEDILRTSTNLVVESPKIIEYFYQSSLHIRIKINQNMLNLTGMINEIIAGRFTIEVDIIYPNSRSVPVWRHKRTNIRMWFLNYSNQDEYTRVISYIEYLKRVLPEKFNSNHEFYDFNDNQLTPPIYLY